MQICETFTNEQVQEYKLGLAYHLEYYKGQRLETARLGETTLVSTSTNTLSQTSITESIASVHNTNTISTGITTQATHTNPHDSQYQHNKTLLRQI